MGDRVSMVLPEPPTLNEMLDLAKQRTPRRIPVVYNLRRKEYALTVKAALDSQGLRPPKPEWDQWEILRCVFRVYNPKDPLELLASLKWAVDALVRWGWVKDDGAQELVFLPPYWGLVPGKEVTFQLAGLDGIWQVVDRENRGVSLEIQRVDLEEGTVVERETADAEPQVG